MDLSEYSFVIVGSGLLGSVVAERITSQLGQKILLIEKRNHVGGNCFSEVDKETNIEFHKYGTHIFHTDNERVWKYINQFTNFNSYRHQVLSSYQNKIYQLPINLETINSFYNITLKPFEVDDFLARLKTPLEKAPSNFEEKAISIIGKDLYEAFIKSYTEKQWQVDPKQLPASIFNRLPFRKNYHESYYFDKWQGVPTDGYATMFNKLLSDKKITVLLNTDFFSVRNQLKKNAIIIYSGPIDKFFDYRFGKLSWRTLSFHQETISVEDFQGNAVINYPEKEIPYIRIHEPKHLHPERNYTTEKTIIFKEYSMKDDGKNPFYPILSDDNQQKYDLYKKEADQLKNVFIAGRLGDYKYYDMHQTIEKALDIFETGIAPQIGTIS
ncbi:MAG: UDP-galactopyranose mutase [Bacteroidetes bacterium]|nr:UDP-galactopyranose mutase [Bacteroidota bacterium]